ncbi:acyl carrier protein [Streptomyces aurantiacus]|uniref:acyl carrier protein n=1 Tax=Streptomyces aurantiacus TaxID=47760 RepID=UPI002790A135|nr:acyl carrier protein [Streptomyces aurantiacus]MDQ0779971.1 acyl carrier protein [Streptomyces aurantiacus]
MSTDLREVVVDALRNMHFEVDSATDETPLGDGGLELESLSLSELVMQLDSFGVEFSDEEMEKLAEMTLGEFTEEAKRRAAVN